MIPFLEEDLGTEASSNYNGLCGSVCHPLCFAQTWSLSLTALIGPRSHLLAQGSGLAPWPHAALSRFLFLPPEVFCWFYFRSEAWAAVFWKGRWGGFTGWSSAPANGLSTHRGSHTKGSTALPPPQTPDSLHPRGPSPQQAWPVAISFPPGAPCVFSLLPECPHQAWPGSLRAHAPGRHGLPVTLGSQTAALDLSL